jgi:hypothetical protein
MLVTLEARAVKVGVYVRLRVRPSGEVPGVATLSDRLDALFADLVGQERDNAALVDSDMNATVTSDTEADLEVRLTVEAADAGHATETGLGFLRAAVRAAGLDATEESVDAKPLVGA